MKSLLSRLSSLVSLTTLFYLEAIQPVIAWDAENKSETSQKIKLKLDVSGPDNEWIRIDIDDSKAGNRVITAYHTKRVKRSFPSNLANGVLEFGASEIIDGYDGPVPFPRINFHKWADHKTLRLLFKPNHCPESMPNCATKGTTSIVLSNGTDIRAGKFTIEYAEKDLIRTITFKIPSDKDNTVEKKL